MADFEQEGRPSLITGRTWDDYYENLAERVRKDDLDPDTHYSFMAELTMSQYGEIGEFQARLEQIDRDSEMGRASLILCLIDPETNDPIIALDSRVEDDMVTPVGKRRITHPRIQGIGTIETGYLLGPEAALVPNELHVPKFLRASAFVHDPTDPAHTALLDTNDRAMAFEARGIILGQE